MKYAVISDVHGNYPALKAVMEDAEMQGISHFLFAGDYCISGPWPDECISTIRSVSEKHVIRGNEEKYLEDLIGKDQSLWTDGQMQVSYWCYRNVRREQLDYLLGLPHTEDFEYNGIKIHMAHSSVDFLGTYPFYTWNSVTLAERMKKADADPRRILSDMDIERENDPEFQKAVAKLEEGIYIFGHSHIQWSYKAKDKDVYLINPGSCGLPLDGIRESVPYTVLEIDDAGRVSIEEKRIPFDKEAYIDEVKQTGQYREANVWTNVIITEQITACEHMYFFLDFVGRYAKNICDDRRPYAVDTWEKAYEIFSSGAIPDIICVARPSQSSRCDYFSCDKYGLRVDLSEDKENVNPICTDMKVRITNTSEEDFKGVVHLKLMLDEKEPGFFMPGFMYNTNTADKPSSGRKAFPRIKRNPGGMPESEYFMTRSDRLAEPVSIVYAAGKVKGIAAPPYWVNENGKAVPVQFKDGEMLQKNTGFLQYGGFSCNINDNGRVSVGYTLGYEDAPWLFVQTANVMDREAVGDDNSFCIKAGETIEFPIIIYDYDGKDERAIYRALSHAYDIFHEAPRTVSGMNEEKAITLLSSAIRDNAWLEEEKMYSGFVYDREEGPRYNKIGSLSWTNGLAVAVPMLLAANRLHDDEARRQSLSFIDNVIQNSFNPDSGLLYDAVEDGKWSVYGWWYNGMHSGGHSAYLNGQAVYYILKAYLSEKKEQDIIHDDWIAFVEPVIQKMNAEMNSDHEYPFSMSEHTGAGLEYDSMGGAWCLAATALYELITDDDGYLNILKKSEQHYYDAYVVKCECYGGPLDTDKAVDDEGILAYIRAVRILHEITKEDSLLDHMRDALYYECSFKLSYNTPVSVMPLSRIGWSSCGGSITSTANPHIHPMSSTIIPEMKYYVDARDDGYMRSRLEDTVKWSLQTFNTYDREYGYGGPGWMSERFCFCRGLLTEKYPDGSPASTWFALMPWASASIIEGLAQLPE